MSARPEPWKVPETWEWLFIGDVCEIVSGGTPKTGEPANWEGGSIPWITPADLTGFTDKQISTGKRNITQRGLDSSSATLIPQGAVLFSSRAPIGYVAVAANPVATNQGFKSFVPPNELDAQFLFYFLKRARSLALALSSGTTFQEVSKKRAAMIPLALAPLPEQRRIVAKLDELFAELDAGVAALERAQAKLKRYRASVLKAAVGGKLTEEWRRNNPPDETGEELLQRILVERRKRWEQEQLAKFTAKGQKPTKNWQQKYRDPVEPNISKLPELPEGWCWATVDQITGRQSHIRLRGSETGS